MSETAAADAPDYQPFIDQCRALGIDDASINVRIRFSDLIDVDFDRNKLVNVLDYLRNTSGVNFSVNWTSLEAADVEQGLAISMSLRGVSFEQVLRLVLEQADPVGLVRIGYVIRKGIVYISATRDFTNERELRTFNVRHLLIPVANEITIGELEGGLVTLIQDTIGHQTEWFGYGGDVSHAQILNGILTVKTTPEYQIDIAELLSQLSQSDLIGREKPAASSETGNLFEGVLDDQSGGLDAREVDPEPPPAGDPPPGNAPPPAKGTGDLSASRLKAKGIYEWAISENGIPGAAEMTISDLFDAILHHAEFDGSDLPPNADTFGRYLRDAGVKRYGSRGRGRASRSVRAADQVENRSSQSRSEPD